MAAMIALIVILSIISYVFVGVILAVIGMKLDVAEDYIDPDEPAITAIMALTWPVWLFMWLFLTLVDGFGALIHKIAKKG